MLTKNLTPFPLGLKAGSRNPPAPEMTLVVKGTFALRPGEPLAPLAEQPYLTAEGFAEDDDERAGECLYPGDFADWKPTAEVMLRGTCYAPGGRPVDACEARLSVGKWSKALRVLGRRVWRPRALGEELSEPAPFVKMALDFAHAFGGPEHPANPVGKGFGTPEGPNLERAGEPVKSPRELHTPACFGPVSPQWPVRRARLGSDYGETYRRTRAPFYASDFDPRWFSAAPPDQQLRGYLRGDEEVALHNLHPTAREWRVTLPGLRLVAFVKDDTGRFRSVKMCLDTLWLEPDAGLLALQWRGVDRVRELDLSDVTTVLVASEPLAEPPLPEEHYRAELEGFERDPVGLAAKLRTERVARAEQRGGAAAPPSEALRAAVRAKVRAVMGDGPAPAHDAAEREMVELLVQELAGRGPEEEVLKGLAREDDAPPVPMPRKPGAMPSLGLRKVVRRKLAELDRSRAELEAGDTERAAGLAAVEAKLREAPFGNVDAGYSFPRPLTTDAPGPGVDLTDRDLTGADLRGRDLRGAILDGAVLSRADLCGADLEGASLRDAVLFRADLSDANLTGADLGRANATRARLAGATLERAVLEHACVEGAVLTDARLGGAQGEYAAFARADLTGAKLRGASLPHADFTGAVLERADLAQASLGRACFDGCRAPGVDLRDADAPGARFERAELAGARAGGLSAPGAYFHGAKLDGADLALARLRGAHLTLASLVGSSLYGADLRDARLYRCRLERADLVRANLFGADLCRADARRARLEGASLYEAKLLGTNLDGADFTEAVLIRAVRDEGIT
ncbi:MAG: DUF2169 domain-containing protein [Myxococcales bacterium]|nr:DUF2169 domain-containing protein [Myxococcales bacterium]